MNEPSVFRWTGSLRRAYGSIGRSHKDGNSAAFTKENDMTTNETHTVSKAPTHIAYQVRDRKTKAYWSRVGVAWSHKNNLGLHIQLDSMPFDGAIVLRVVREER